ncbi:Oidioi.mRNA.OKI2018_I69.chr2.g6059.t1.cds [Oikopleura dioica]|uniref:Oidioi.mRNA.OKI2018_I69.chr2.g6059.t1.cds n=1 Tax=Oikopleura dioica TaxID=34765 RepID=A0ABN7T1T2_OIKDI|nr:Oidioi.mRNA.OKI2018_I69.chr2.g6059.t1.cds [Oikopleura dioica]
MTRFPLRLPLRHFSFRQFSISSSSFGRIRELNDFDEFFEWTSEEKILVYFYAEWCNLRGFQIEEPCKESTRALEKCVKSSKAELIKVDFDEYDDISAHYTVDYLPQTLLIAKNKELDRFIGNKDEEFIKEFLKKNDL